MAAPELGHRSSPSVPLPAGIIQASPQVKICDRTRKKYEISTAGETLTIHDIARGFTQVLGRPIAYEQMPLDAWLVRIEPILAGDTQLRRHVSVSSRALSSGRVVGRTTDIVERLTHRVPQNIEQFAAVHRSMLE